MHPFEIERVVDRGRGDVAGSIDPKQIIVTKIRMFGRPSPDIPPAHGMKERMGRDDAARFGRTRDRLVLDFQLFEAALFGRGRGAFLLADGKGHNPSHCDLIAEL